MIGSCISASSDRIFRQFLNEDEYMALNVAENDRIEPGPAGEDVNGVGVNEDEDDFEQMVSI
jgi:hypothetical protein